MSTSSMSSSGNLQIDPHPTGSDSFARLLALACVVLCSTYRYWFNSAPVITESFLALMGVIGVVMARNGRTDGLGLKVVPNQGWWYWFRFALGIGLVIGILAIILSAVVWFGHFRMPIARMAPRDLWYLGPLMVVYAPVLEEVVYRLLLCFALQLTLGFRGTIVVSGVLFALIHWPNNPGPDNQIAGFFLAYVYLRSESLAVPIAMHAGGNALAVTAQVFNWHFLPAVSPG